MGLAVAGLPARRIVIAEQASKPVTFTKDIAPIIYDRCGQCHHPDGAGPFSLLTYSDARQHATQIAVATKARFMPPWKSEPGYGEFIGQQPLTDNEIATIEQWAATGAPEGDRRNLPPVPKWSEAWQLGAPNLIVTLPKPYVLRADGPDFSRIFVFRLPVDRTRYVRGFEFRPGNTRVVHHANVRIDRTPASRELDEKDPEPGYAGVRLHSAVYPDGHFLGWTPGQVAPLLPKGLAWTLTPGTDLVIEMHLVPTGKAESIQPSIGLYFTDDPPERTPEMVRLGRQSIDIPAGEKAYTITDSFVLPVDAEVQAVQPHAHYRAREVKGTATLPDGTLKPLIYIKDWDFRWQHVYRYITPFWLPKGTKLSMQITFDNSAANPRNPQQPPQRVLWGQQSNDEMGDLWIQMLARDERDRQTLDAAIQPKEMIEDVIGYEVMVGRDPSNTHLHDDVGLLYLTLGRLPQATVHFEATAALKPESAPAHFNLGTVLTLAGRRNEAMTEYRKALEIKPDYAQAHNNLGNALLLEGNADEALTHFREALRLNSANAEAHYNVGSLARSRGNLAEAIGHFRESVALNPDSAPAAAGLAWLLATAPDAALRDSAEAMRLGERLAQKTDGRDAAVLDLLAAAYAAAGQFDRAVATAEAALNLKPGESIAAVIRDRQEMYRHGIPYLAR